MADYRGQSGKAGGAASGDEKVARQIDAAFAAHERGLLGEVERLCRDVLRRQPKHFEALHLMGVVAGQTGRRDLGIKLLRRALEEKPHAHDALNHLANLLKDNRQLREAAAVYRRSLALMPNYAAAHNNLGLLHLTEEHYADAASCFSHAVEIEPGFANAWFHLAEALDRCDERQRAEAAYRRALAVAPQGDLAPLWAGSILMRLGRFAEASDFYRRVIARDPCHIPAFHGLAAAIKIVAADRPMIDSMAKLVADPGLASDDLRKLNYALGKAFDDLGEPARAMHHFDKANRMARQKREGTGKSFNSARHVAFVDELIATFTPEFFAARENCGSHSELPVLIVGMPRSGTTLIEQIVSCHPGVAAGDELRFWREHAGALGPSGIGAVDRSAARKMADKYVKLLTGIAPAAQRVTDKMPHNFLSLGLIHMIFPRARIIHCRRNSIDTALSIYFNLDARYAHCRADIVAYYKEYLKLMAHWRNVMPPDRLLEVDYEAVVADREREARRMIAFIGLDWDEACVRHEENDRIVRTPSMWQVRQPIYKDSLERWRRYEPWLGELRELLPQPSQPYP